MGHVLRSCGRKIGCLTGYSRKYVWKGRLRSVCIIFTARLKSSTLWPIVVEETLKVSDWECNMVQLVFKEE